MIFSPYSIIAIHPSSAATLWDQRRTRSARREGAILRDHMTSYSAFHHATIRDRFAQTHTYTSMPPSSSSASMDRRERTMGRRGRGDNTRIRQATTEGG